MHCDAHTCTVTPTDALWRQHMHCDANKYTVTLTQAHKTDTPMGVVRQRLWEQIENDGESKTRMTAERSKTRPQNTIKKSSNERLFIRPKRNMRISGVIPFTKLQNDT